MQRTEIIISRHARQLEKQSPEGIRVFLSAGDRKFLFAYLYAHKSLFHLLAPFPLWVFADRCGDGG